MRAQKIIEGSSFGPEVLKVLQEAFDQAWAAVDGNFMPHEHVVAREVLASYLTSIMRDDSTDVASLREAGIRSIRESYPQRFKSDDAGQNGTDG